MGAVMSETRETILRPSLKPEGDALAAAPFQPKPGGREPPPLKGWFPPFREVRRRCGSFEISGKARKMVVSEPKRKSRFTMPRASERADGLGSSQRQSESGKGGSAVALTICANTKLRTIMMIVVGG